MQEFVFVLVFISIFFSPLLFSILYVKRKEKIMANRIKKMEDELYNIKEEVKMHKIHLKNMKYNSSTSKFINGPFTFEKNIFKSSASTISYYNKNNCIQINDKCNNDLYIK